MSSQCSTVIDRAVRVFGVDGSVLAQLVPVEWVRQVLAEAGIVSRTRRMSAVFGVYLVLASTLFPQMSVLGVFESLTGVWGRPGAQVPSKASLRQRKARLGVEPFRLLFHRLCQAGPEVVGGRWRGLLVCAWDGTTVEAPDCGGNAAAFGKNGNQHPAQGFPLVQLLVLVACGSRALLGAAVDTIKVGETTLASRLLDALRPGMLLLADRNFTSYALWCQAVRTEADLLWRMKSTVKFQIYQVLPDGSALAWWNASSRLRKTDRVALALPDRVPVRVITGWVAVIDEHGVRRTEPYRLATTLVDHRTHPALKLVQLYARRWQVELMIKGLKQVQGIVQLRSKTPAGARQEVWAWLCTHQLLRLEAARAAADAGCEPDGVEVRQISFTTLVRRLTSAVIRAAGSGHTPTILADFREATREDVTPIDIRIRIWDRVVKHPQAGFPSKKPHHRGCKAVYEYSIAPATLPPAATPTPTRETTTDNHHQPSKINS